MKHVLLIVGRDSAYTALSEDQTKQMYAAHERFGAMLAERGVMVDGAELLPETRTVTPRGEDRVVTAGPFAEASEGIGGWYIVETPDIDAAAEFAKELPILSSDHVEVRPIRG